MKTVCKLQAIGKSSSLTSAVPMLYEEHCWRNETNSSVVIIDATNQKTELPPRNYGAYGPNIVKFERRRGYGPTKTEGNVNLPLDYEELIIKESDLLVEPIFIKELNIVVCPISMSHSVNHPYSSACYTDVFNRSVNMFEDSFKEGPGVTFVANDPQQRLTEIYTFMYDNPVCIPVTSIVDDTPDATLTCIFQTVDGIYKQVINIEEIIEKQTIPLNNEIIQVVSTSRLGAQQYAHNHKMMTQEEYDEAIKRVELIQKKNFDNLRAQAEADKNALETKLKTAEQERDEYKAKYTSIKANIDASVDFRTADLKEEQIRASTQSAQIKLETEQRKNQFAETEAKIKLWHLVAAAALPYVIKGLFLLMKQTAESK